MIFAKVILNAFLFMPVINSQRVTLMESSFHSNYDLSDWTNTGGEIKDEEKCPDRPCLKLDYREEVYRGVSTVGYHSIKFSYSLQSTGDAQCYIYYTQPRLIGSIVVSGWEIMDSRQSVDRSVNVTLSFQPSHGAEDNPNFRISLYNSLYSNGDDIFCYYNDAKLTGIPITPSPTFSPSYSPTPLTNEPTSSPTIDPTPTPSDNPSDATRNPSETPTISPSNYPTSPTLDPTKLPSESPTREPTIEPTLEPTLNPTPRSGEVGSWIDYDSGIKNTMWTEIDPLNERDSSTKSMLTILLAVGAILISFICVIFGLCLLRRIRMQRDNAKSTEVTMVAIDRDNGNGKQDGFENEDGINKSDVESDASDSNGMYPAKTKTTQATKDEEEGADAEDEENENLYIRHDVQTKDDPDTAGMSGSDKMTILTPITLNTDIGDV